MHISQGSSGFTDYCLCNSQTLNIHCIWERELGTHDFKNEMHKLRSVMPTINQFHKEIQNLCKLNNNKSATYWIQDLVTFYHNTRSASNSENVSHFLDREHQYKHEWSISYYLHSPFFFLCCQNSLVAYFWGNDPRLSASDKI